MAEDKYACPQCGRQNPTVAIECPRCHAGNPITGTSFLDWVESLDLTPELRADIMLNKQMSEAYREGEAEHAEKMKGEGQ